MYDHSRVWSWITVAYKTKVSDNKYSPSSVALEMPNEKSLFRRIVKESRFYEFYLSRPRYIFARNIQRLSRLGKKKTRH